MREGARWNASGENWESDRLYQTRLIELALHGPLAHSLCQSTASALFWPVQLPASVLQRGATTRDVEGVWVEKATNKRRAKLKE